MNSVGKTNGKCCLAVGKQNRNSVSTEKVSEEETKRKCHMSAFPPDTPLRWNDGQSRKKSAEHQSANKEEKNAPTYVKHSGSRVKAKRLGL